MLHSRRRRLAQLAEREAAGDSFWSDEFPERARVRLVHVFRVPDRWYEVAQIARGMILSDEGLFLLVGSQYQPSDDFIKYATSADDDMLPTIIEAFAVVLAALQGQGWREHEQYDAYVKAVNTILREERIAFELNGVEMVPFSSQEMHVEVVAPVLRLLGASSEWDPVETAYRKALAELSRGDAADAITDAGTALQEALTLLGCDGNSLGPLIKSARKRGILASHDVPMADAFEKIATWVSADRSTSGDAHHSDAAQVEDAWLIVHVVGALLVRLSKGTARPNT